MRWLIPCTLLVLSACTDVVPREEVRAFEANQAAIDRYKAFSERRLAIDTSVGRLIIQLLPDTYGYVDTFLSWVDDGVYDGMRFHRAIHDPVPFGVQVGDPLTKGVLGHDFNWGEDSIDSSPVAGYKNFPEPISQIHTDNEKVSSFDVILVGRPGEKEISSHIFIALTNDFFMEDSYTVIGHVVYNQSILSHIEVGTRIETVQWLAKDKSISELPLPRKHKTRLSKQAVR